MADVRKAQGDPLCYLQALVVAAGPQQRNGGLGVVQIVDRHNGRIAGALGFPVLPLGFGDLDMGGVPQHDIAQIAGFCRGINSAAEAVFAQFGQHTRVVDMGVGQKHRLYLGSRDRQRDIFKHIHTLLHAAVHQIVSSAYLQQGA